MNPDQCVHARYAQLVIRPTNLTDELMAEVVRLVQSVQTLLPYVGLFGVFGSCLVGLEIQMWLGHRGEGISKAWVSL